MLSNNENAEEVKTNPDPYLAAFEADRGYMEELIIPNGVTKIGLLAFTNCNNLATLVIPKGVKSIGDNAFMNCYVLKSLDIPEGVTYIGDYAFRYCRKLTYLNIPGSVTHIGYNAFAACPGECDIHFAKTKAEVSSMENYPWGIEEYNALPVVAVIHCTDGDLNVSYVNKNNN